MGEVFLVQHPRLPRQDALKLLDAGVSRSDDFKARFRREADLLAQLSHPNIVTLYDRGEYQERLWIAMEFVNGTDAGELTKSHGPLPIDVVNTLIRGAGAALDYAWRKQRITHRDVKPTNILVAIDGDQIEGVKLADFGIAKAAGESTSLTSTGMAVGTMNYISPEAIEGHEVDNRSDVYSLGCTAYHLLTGRPPHTGPTMASLLSAHLSRPVPDITSVAPHLPESMNDVIARALAKHPHDRYQSCDQFVTALAAATDSTADDAAYSRTMTAAMLHGAAPVTAGAPAAQQDFTGAGARGSRVAKLLAGAAAIVAVAVAALAVLLIRHDSTTRPPQATSSPASPIASTAAVTSSTAKSALSPPQTETATQVETPILEAPVTTTVEPVIPAPVEGQPCNPGVDTRSPDGTLSCSGLHGTWRDMSYLENPPVQWNAPCSEPGSQARVQNTDAVVTCKPDPSGGYTWKQ